jgi:hypothetical protein
MMKDKEVNDGVPIKTTLAGNLEEIIDVEIMTITVEKQPNSSGFTGLDGGCDESSRDAEEG